MQAKLKPLVWVLGFTLAATTHSLWAADDNNAATNDTKASSGSKTADDSPVMEMSPIEVHATSQAKNYVAPISSTGTKTDTPLMETPVNIQVITPQVLEDQTATSLDQALTNVSGVISNESNQEHIIIRGFDTNQTVFVDGFRIYDYQGTGNINLTNTDTIEVMKGPAATLYGEAQPGGIINIVSKQPQATPYSSVEQSVGSWNHYITKFDSTGPVNEDKTLLYRLDGSYDTSNYWRDGVYNKSTSIAPTFKWIISPQTQATIKVEYTHNPYVVDNGQVVPFINGQLVPISRTANFYDPALDRAVDDTTRIGFNWSHQFNDDWSIKNQFMSNSAHGVGTYVNGGAGFLPPGTPGNIGNDWNFSRNASYTDFTQNTKATSLDLTGHFDTAGLKHTLLMGADYSITTSPTSFMGGLNNSTISVSNPVEPGSAALALDPNNLYYSGQNTYDTGAYIQDQIKLPHNVDLLAGLRYQAWRLSSWYDLEGSTNAGFTGLVQNPSYNDSAVTPRLGIVWEAEKWLSLYGQYSDNYFPNQGFDYQHQTLKATGAKNEEIGLKTQTVDGKLKATLTYFDLTKTNVVSADLTHLDLITGLYDYQTTIGEVNSKGVELDVQGEIKPHWNVIVTYAYTDAKVTFDTNTPSTVGNRMQNVPLNMASLWNTYDFTNGEMAGWTLGGGIVARGSSLDASNTITTPGYAILNAMARYTTKWNKSKLTTQVNINNLFNVNYYVSSSYDYRGYGNMAGVNYGNPLAVMATVKLEY